MQFHVESDAALLKESDAIGFRLLLMAILMIPILFVYIFNRNPAFFVLGGVALAHGVQSIMAICNSKEVYLSSTQRISYWLYSMLIAFIPPMVERIRRAFFQ